MSDSIQYLREVGTPKALEAADEIERLLAALSDAEARINALEDQRDHLLDQIGLGRAPNELSK